MLSRAVISRDLGEPWGPTGMSSAAWLDVQVRHVPIRELIATQPCLYIEALGEAQADRAPVGGDPFPHVIVWQGRSYLEDGHHRTMRALLEGRRLIAARVLMIPSMTEEEPCPISPRC